MSRLGGPTAEVERAMECPFCGCETEIQREIDPVLGRVALDELEVLVRNEWRRRLGSAAYLRDQSRPVIRALIVYGLAPGSPVREAVLRETLGWELTRLEALGLERGARQRELGELGHAIRDTLLAVAPEAPECARRLSDPIQEVLSKLLAAPVWPASN